MHFHFITESNQSQFYCKSGHEPKNGKLLVQDNVEYSIAECACGKTMWKRENFHVANYPDNKFFINLEVLLLT